MLNQAPFAKVARAPGRSTGFSLVELMISITIGLIVVAGVISIFSSAIKSYSDNLKMTRLNQELRVVMDMMVRDIRRAGYWGGTSSFGPVNPNPLNTTANRLVVGTVGATGGTVINAPPNTGGNCIAFAYDRDGEGNFTGGDDQFGFRLNPTTGIINARDGGPAEGTDCNFTAIQPITDGDTIEITTLTFTIPRVCPLTNSIGTVLLITNTAAAQYRIIRTVQITLTGQLRSDPTIARFLQETVRVQNDEIANPTAAPC